MKVLVVSAHPDDETLGCGGTLLKHKASNDELAWLITTNVTEESGFSDEIISRRQNEIKEVATEYGIKKIYIKTVKI